MEVTIPERTQLISITDLKGTIIYANDVFIEISGYSEQELIGKPHRLVRHEDMPKEAFANLWGSLKEDRSWRGLVKNRCKNGDFYWVDAYVTPLYESGQKIGYQSVRSTPNREQVNKAEVLYANIKAGKAKRAMQRVSALNRCMGLCVVMILMGVTALLLKNVQLDVIAIVLALSMGLTGIVIKLAWSLKALSTKARCFQQNALIQKVFCDDMTETGDVEMALAMLHARNRTVLGRLGDIGRTIQGSVELANQSIQLTDQGICQQDQETDMVAAAIHEMSTATDEIAQNIAQTSNEVINVRTETCDGRRELAMTVSNIAELATEIDSASGLATTLEQQMSGIIGVVQMITSIAEQTNLLALNAAIEAARAGDKGRGFAVVADEVRTLASRTQVSTEEISKAIHDVENSVLEVAAIMRQTRLHAESTVNVVEHADHTFAEVEATISAISDRCMQVASAAEQQSKVVEETEKNVIAIRDLAAKNSQSSQQTAQASSGLKALVEQLESMTTAFDQ